MRAAYSVAQIRAAEAAAMSLLPEGALMQRAAFALAARCAEILRSSRGRVRGSSVVVLCGAGNNGGDALFAVARLARMGATVRVVQVGSALHEDGRTAAVTAGARIIAGNDPLAIAMTMDADLVLDAIVGIGGAPGLRGNAPELAAAALVGDGIVVAVDLPSGIDPDTGAAGDSAIQADVTVTFGAIKTGLLTGAGRALTGVLHVVDLGLDLYLLDYEPLAFVLEAADVDPFFAEPSDSDYKYSRGVVQVIAGSEQYPGAAFLAVGGARCGPAGLIRLAGEATSSVVARYPDVVASIGRTDAIVVGPGIGIADAATGRLEHAIGQNVPLVIDADALTLLAAAPDLLNRRHVSGAATVLTPHAGEAVRLGVDPVLLRTNRYEAARWLAAKYGAVVALKGPGTVVATPEGGPIYVDAAGDAALATAGTGDVLAGLIGSVLANEVGRGPLSHRHVASAVAAAAFVHGVAGRLAAAEDAPVRATDVVEALPAAVAMLRG
jgi:hydroxyethylthiazole kinase-like uncharacterized protein yjeF